MRRPGRPRQSRYSATGATDAAPKVSPLPIPPSSLPKIRTNRDETGAFSELVGESKPSAGENPPKKQSKRAARSTRGQSGTRPAASSNRRPGRVTNRGKVRTQQQPRRGWLGGGVALSLKAIATIAVVAVTAVVAVPVCLQWAEQRRQYDAVSAELDSAKQKREHLEEQLENWEDRDFIAAQARSRLGYVEKGETQYSVADAPVTETGTQAEISIVEPPPKPWALVLQDSLLESDNPAPEVPGIDDARVPQPTDEDDEE